SAAAAGGSRDSVVDFFADPRVAARRADGRHVLAFFCGSPRRSFLADHFFLFSQEIIPHKRSRLPTRLDQRCTKSINHLLPFISYGQGREPKDPFAAHPHVVLTLHVRPPRPHLHVLAAIDLNVQLPLFEVRVAVAPATRRVAHHGLASWKRQPSLSAQIEK